MTANPRDGFRSFLEKAESDGWIAGFNWIQAENFFQLRQKMGGLNSSEDHSKTYKRSTDGKWWGIDVEAHYGTAIGIDLDLLMPRPVLEDSSWITTRLGISRSMPPRNILEEWSARASAFRALAPENEKINISQFRRTAPATLTVYTPEGERNVQIRTAWMGRWVFNLAWRTR